MSTSEERNPAMELMIQKRSRLMTNEGRQKALSFVPRSRVAISVCAGHSDVLKVSSVLVLTFIFWDFRLSCKHSAQIHVRLAYLFLETPCRAGRCSALSVPGFTDSWHHSWYFTFGIGNRTSTCVLDLFTCNHYLPNGFLLFSTGSWK
jgi:hypothetical protein